MTDSTKLAATIKRHRNALNAMPPQMDRHIIMRNSHAALLDIAEAAGRVVQSAEDGDVGHIDELGDALARLVEGNT